MRINDKVLRLKHSKGANCFLILGDEMTLIDTSLGFNGKGILSDIIALGIEPTAIQHILLTHHDLDHIGNIQLLAQATGAKVWAHQQDIPYITGEQTRPGFKKFIGLFANKKNLPSLHAYTADMQVGNIQIIHTPGHTPGHVSMLYDDVLFVGDLLENKKGQLRPYPKPWNHRHNQLLSSIDQLKSLDYTWICMAHGKPMKTRIDHDAIS